MMLDHCIIGDCRDGMRQLIQGGVRVQTVVTSPPYWGVRDYGVGGQFGLERSPIRYLARMRSVFRLVWDLLADDGTLWLNMGDSYAGAPGGYQGRNGQRASRTFTARIAHHKRGNGLKPKDLVGMPWLLALTLRADGWYLRRDIIWSKPNPMPESAQDRPTTAHEYIFLLSKSERYYYDAEAIREPGSPETHARKSRAFGGYAPPGQTQHRGILSPRDGLNPKSHGSNGKHKKPVGGWATGTGSHSAIEHATPGGDRTKFRVKQNESFTSAISAEVLPTRNKRSVWTVPSQPFPEAHFATFPEKLIEPCILAGSRTGDTVFDPFMGAGTVAAVATRLGRHWLGCEIKAEYEAMQKPRVAQLGMAI